MYWTLELSAISLIFCVVLKHEMHNATNANNIVLYLVPENISK